MIINSLNNAHVKNWAKLQQKKYRDATNEFLVEGDHLVNEAINCGWAVEIISLKPYEIDLPNYVVTPEVMQKISTQVTISDVACICRKKSNNNVSGKTLILDALQDPGNLGTIIRSAVAFNFDTIILGANTVDLYNEKVIRASEGMLFHINIVKADLEKIIPDLKQKNYQIIGTDVKKGSLISHLSNPKNIAIVIGNEGAGLSKSVYDLCDVLVNIPINNKCESLNAAVAASILMYEMR